MTKGPMIDDRGTLLSSVVLYCLLDCLRCPLTGLIGHVNLTLGAQTNDNSQFKKGESSRTSMRRIMTRDHPKRLK
jgi:hypothetical protein